MKILLLGEYSSLYKNLKDGLVELGHDVTTASNGDGFKKIPTDIDLSSPFPGLLGSAHRQLQPFLNLSNFKGYDVVQLINPFVFSPPYFYSIMFHDYLINNNEKFFVSAAGSDAYFYKYARERLRYTPLKDCLKYDDKVDCHAQEKSKYFEFNKRLIEKSNGVIPIMYEYEVVYRDCDKRLKTIPIPLNMDKIQYQKNTVGEKLTVFHGLNRYGFKGTRFVEEAFKILNTKYPNDLELIIDGQMPLDQYLELMQRTNVIIDQVNSYSCGVNAIYALAMGKVVLGGAEPESLPCLGVASSPVINITPSAESIVSEVEQLLEQKKNISDLGHKSRLFAENVHNHIEVAKQYLDVWSKN